MEDANCIEKLNVHRITRSLSSVICRKLSPIVSNQAFVVWRFIGVYSDLIVLGAKKLHLPICPLSC